MTHINAYFADVEDAEAKVVQAEGELEAAKQRLAAKKVEEGFKEPVKEPSDEDAVPAEPLSSEPKDEPKVEDKVKVADKPAETPKSFRNSKK